MVVACAVFEGARVAEVKGRFTAERDRDGHSTQRSDLQACSNELHV